MQKDARQYPLELLRPALLDQAPGEVQNAGDVITVLECRVDFIENPCSDHHQVIFNLAESLYFC
jgi:hypothetical protein